MEEASIAHLSHWVAFYPSSISKCLGMDLICQRILLNVCSTLGFKICTCWAENLSPPSRPPPPGADPVTCYSVFSSLAGRGAFSVLLRLQCWAGAGSQWSCPSPGGRCDLMARPRR